jgi:hypothetical protein
LCGWGSTPARRRAFTLLEVLLAAGIGVLLLGALYVAVDIQLRHSQSGRDVIEQSTLARALLHRMASDIAPALAPPSPTRYHTSSSSQGSGGGSQAGGSQGTQPTGVAPSGGSTGAGAASANSAGSANSSSGSASGSGSGSTTGTSNYVFTVQGDSGRLTVYVSRVPRELLTPDVLSGSDTPPVASDLRRVTYWLAGDGSLGLARQELQTVTSDDAATVPPDGVANEADAVIAPEVKSLSFSYFDGSNWQDSWDGSTAGPDGVTPMGPPLAIAVVIGLVPPGGEGGAVKSYRHVISVSTANGATTQQVTTTTQTSGM